MKSLLIISRGKEVIDIPYAQRLYFCYTILIVNLIVVLILSVSHPAIHGSLGVHDIVYLQSMAHIVVMMLKLNLIQRARWVGASKRLPVGEEPKMLQLHVSSER